MLTVKHLMDSGILGNAKLLSGKDGLDKEISWVYAKHTKDITPWVSGGEFLLVSGYESDFGEGELLKLVEEAGINDIAGILIEGGLNFKEISEDVLMKSDEEKLPLFFAKGVISFLDMTKDISILILENESKENLELIDKLLEEVLTKEEISSLFYSANINPNSNFLVASFEIYREKNNRIGEETTSNVFLKFTREIEKSTREIFKRLNIEEIYRVKSNRLEYLLYAKNKEELDIILSDFIKIWEKMVRDQDDYKIRLFYSGIVDQVEDIVEAFHEMYFTYNLSEKGLVEGLVLGFEDIGSYQILSQIKDQKKLIKFRNYYLKKLYDIDKDGSLVLLETLREYLMQNGNMMQTAKNLIIHRNTLIYRIDRIESITNFDVNDYKTRRDLMNAFMILDMLAFTEEGEEKL